jgi:hypothetical protein
MAANDGSFAQFRLLGGPLHELALRIGARFGIGSAAVVGVCLVVALWLILAVLTVVEGSTLRFFALETTAIHMRLLVGMPLILWCAELLDRAVRNACGALVDLGIVAGDARSVLDAAAGRLMRISTSWWLLSGLLLAVALLALLTPAAYLPGVSGYRANLMHPADTLAGNWYWHVCLPAFRFVIARFLCLLCIWTILVWRLSRQHLHLEALHPDRAAGLGLLEVAQSQLVVLILAVSLVDTAALVETFQTVAANKPLVYLHVILIALVGSFLVSAPLLFLVMPLYRVRRDALVAFGAMAHDYSRQFRARWIGPGRTGHDGLLGSSDIQSLADLASSYETVRTMRILPVTTTLMLVILGCAVIPHLALLLLEYPLSQVLLDLVHAVVGI